MRINDVKSIDNLIEFLKETRKNVAAYQGMERKYAEAQDAYLAAKEAMQEAMDRDDFDAVATYNAAVKKHHKIIADNHDKKLELEDSINEAARRLDQWEDVAMPLLDTDADKETDNLEQAA
ncbi:CO dehydrogenase/acetyl-CoA synthase beta subunit [Oceanisphaera litoralis]|uniref:hypothetical protein n=1 Tax=Oceanisphaera litoralis TaxID=225144 RepID=UPI0019564223|nr:hypothetical protein [Oceanisphaera litoralis]MBM7454516.1 CO dehydrogenase/acetyl-CoA synthase beta subunit [Oceanisphaera litoralis]